MQVVQGRLSGRLVRVSLLLFGFLTSFQCGSLDFFCNFEGVVFAEAVDCSIVMNECLSCDVRARQFRVCYGFANFNALYSLIILIIAILFSCHAYITLYSNNVRSVGKITQRH